MQGICFGFSASFWRWDGLKMSHTAASWIVISSTGGMEAQESGLKTTERVPEWPGWREIDESF